jgi:dTDP-4-amino-4,6-dideoxygalactose transaminase
MQVESGCWRALTGESSEKHNTRYQIPVLVPVLPDANALLPYLHRIDAANWYSNHGPLWRGFRDAFIARLAAQTGTEHLHVAFTPNGTTAVELALRCRALPNRSYCLMPSFTFIASAHAVCNAGLTPYLTDIDPYSMVITPKIAEDALRELPQRPAAVLVISAFGAPPDVAAWHDFEHAYGIPVVFDAAAAAASLDVVGSQPLAVSLHATKVLGIGEGGAVISTDTALIDRITAISGFGYLGEARTSMIRGGNYRISEYAAAIGLAALAGLDSKMARLREVAMEYRERLANSPVQLQDGVGERWVTMTLNVVVPGRRLAGTLECFDQTGVQWRRWWGLGCHTHPAFESLPALDLEVTCELAPRVIGVPCHTKLDTTQVADICDCLLDSRHEAMDGARYAIVSKVAQAAASWSTR